MMQILAEFPDLAEESPPSPRPRGRRPASAVPARRETLRADPAAVANLDRMRANLPKTPPGRTQKLDT